MNKTTTFAVVLFIFCLCRSPDAPAPATPARIDPYWDDLACLLAGLPLRAASPLAPVTRDPAYGVHLEGMRSFWEAVEKRNQEQIVPWRVEHFARGAERGTTLYPLSGADFLNAYNFFPGSDRYILVALEKPGRLSNPIEIETSARNNGLAAVRSVIENVAERNYFMSATMSRYMNGEFAYSGTAPVILIFARRLGFQILDVAPIEIDNAGRIQPREHSADLGNTGIRFLIQRSEDPSPREIVYLNLRLSNESVSPTTASGRFLRSLKHARVLMKSAVYLLHMPSFDGVRDYVLDTADIIVQDDSGVPYRFFFFFEWDVKLFGSFSAPVRLQGTGYYPQPELARAFASEARPLNFQYGYGILRPGGQSNLLIAIRRSPHENE